ncbi:MAG: DUF1697 domain-containing protein [Coriobacteriia bacterium]
MSRDFAAFLRGISNVSMQPFRNALLEIGLTDVGSFGATGNMMFCSRDTDCVSLERRIADAVGVETFVRTRLEMSAIVSEDPYTGLAGASLFLFRGPIDESRVVSFLSGAFEGDPPVVIGTEVHFVHPLRRPGGKGIIDLERELGVRGTMRASRVVARVFDLM